jgi:hypothetical protein
MSIRDRRSVSRSGASFVAALLLSALLPFGAAAQSAQMLSLQVSGLAAYPFGGGLANVDFGGGWEAQLRVNPSAFSIGAGIEQTFHSVVDITGRDVQMIGGFLEPRYVIDIGSDNMVAYVSARAALSQIKLTEGDFDSTGTGYTLNGGGGLLFRLGDRINLDAGATMGYKDLGVLDVPGGLTYDFGTGANVVGRLGLAIGIG